MYDYIIVGGGSAGCVMANRLSASPDIKVLLLEAGPKDNTPLLKAPLGLVLTYLLPKYNWKFWSEPEKSQNNRSVFCPQGKTLGGSSAINGMLYVRGNKLDYDAWAAEGNDGWSFKDILPYFKKSQHQERGADGYHGVDGPLNVKDVEVPNVTAERLVVAGKQAGYIINDDFNGDKQDGIGMYQVTMKGHQRCSAARAYLHPVISRSNLTVITGAEVEKINIEDGRATGVNYRFKNKSIKVSSSKEVILSAGALRSPQILMLSGVGAASELEANGITVKKDLSGVGKNLQEHCDVVITTRSKSPDTFAIRPSVIWRGMKGLIDYLKGRRGMFSELLIESGGFIRSDEKQELPNLQLTSSNALFNNHGLDWMILRNYGYSVHVTLLNPKSRGRVSLKDANFKSAPKINLNMLDHRDDVDALVSGLKKTRVILNQPVYQQHKGDEVFPGVDVQSDEGLRAYVIDKANHIYHPVGTCKMGNGRDAVVDSQLKVYGVKSLRVVDASVMPTIVNGNTNAPTIAIAEKCADMILNGELRPSGERQSLGERELISE